MLNSKDYFFFSFCRWRNMCVNHQSLFFADQIRSKPMRVRFSFFFFFFLVVDFTNSTDGIPTSLGAYLHSFSMFYHAMYYNITPAIPKLIKFFQKLDI